METDDQQPTQENSDKTASDDQETSQTRSYECNFCKRGFSNAQALGGHMNIHRKEKAKLKQFSSNETKQSSPIPKNTSTIQWPWVFGQVKSEEGRVGEVRQLPLFAKAPTDGEEEKPSSFVGDDKQEKGLEELDLELRLGTPEHQDSSATTGTKKFF